MDFSIDATNVIFPTLSLTSFEEEDRDYALVKKIGVGDTTAAGLFPSLLGGAAAASEQLPTEVEKSQCVFHVAQHMSISMPVVGDNLEIRERGSTRIFLTAGSDEIDAHALRSELKFSKVRARRSAASRLAEEAQEQPEYGQGWFIWRHWKVDQTLIQEFSSYIGKILANIRFILITGLTSRDIRHLFYLVKHQNFDPKHGN